MMGLDMIDISDPPNCTASEQQQQQKQQHNRLECFLWNLQVDIPPESFKKDWITITVHDMICTNFRISGVRSSSSSSSSASLKSELDISIKTISATCQGRYHSTGGFAGNVIATVSAAQQQQQQQQVGDDTIEALEVVFSIEGDNITKTNSTTITSLNRRLSSEILPKSFRTISCTTNLQCQSIKFSGSLSAKLIQAFSKTISHYITDAITDNVCPLLPKTIDPLITAYIHKFDEYAQKYLPPSSSSSSSTTNDKLKDTQTKSTIFPACSILLVILIPSSSVVAR